MNLPARLPDLFISSIYISFASTARSDRAAAAPPLPTKLRPRLARSPLQKREPQLDHSSDVSSSTSPELALVVAGRLRTLPAYSSARMRNHLSRSVYLEDLVLGFAAVEPEHGRMPPCAMAKPPSSVAGVLRGTICILTDFADNQRIRS